MQSIEIDFEVYKALTALRQSETDNYNSVLRRVLKLPVGPEEKSSDLPKTAERPWISKGVTFPGGTLLRAPYKGAVHNAMISAGKLVVDGIGISTSLSHAARLITNTAVDGWAFWDVKRPEDMAWRSAKSLRERRRVMM
jgi:hypothetical protein